MALKVLVTGAAGFVGAAMCTALREHGISYRGAVRRAAADRRTGSEVGIEVGNIDAGTDWRAALAGCDTVVHLAARVHMMEDDASDKLAAFRAVNVEATMNLARQAIKAGVKRFVFVSSVKVNGEQTGIGGQVQTFSALDQPAPQDPYGVSKLEAELALRELSSQSGLELVIVRPPLVYGPGVRANFKKLIELVQRGLPLPFGRVANQRSMVALDNLVDLLVVCASDPRAAGQVFMVSDGQDVSLPDLIRLIAGALGKQAFLVPVPVCLMSAAATVLGKRASVARLFGSLQVDLQPTRTRLDWTPVVTMEEAMQETVAAFLADQQKPAGLP
ncbi:MAG: UDP-glucose 4-epimerase family protein [Janthinobacterium lividum]